MKNNQSQKNIPDGWQKVKLRDCLLEKPDYGINAPSVKFSESLPAYIRITDISEDGKFLPEKKTSVKNSNSDSYILDIGDIVLARTGASVGKTYLYNKNDGQLVFAGFLIRVRPDKNKW
jgi:type I restriction enzyme S subunit